MFLNRIRRQLNLLGLEVRERDIYDNKVAAERDFSWFFRHG